MPDRRRLLTVAVVPLPVNLAAFAGLVIALELMDGPSTPFEAGLPFFLIFMLTVFAGTVSVVIFFQDIRRNRDLSDRQRRFWLGVAATFPHALVVYWWRYGRAGPTRG
jgi:hypothetical protein